MTKDPKNLIVALDIGTSKVVVLVAEALPGGNYDIIGIGEHNSKGLRKGVVFNIEETVKSIQKALEEAELMAGCKIVNVNTGIAGSHIRSFNSAGAVPINKEVTSADIRRVIDVAKAVKIPDDQELIHTVPQEFTVDKQTGIKEPIGLSGVRLEVVVHIVTGAVSAVQNIVKCIRRCGLEVSDLMLQPMASADAVLTPDEKELGVVLIDIGGGTTDIAVFRDGAVRYTAVLPVAGDQITNDIAVVLRTPTDNAEDIKCRFGVAKETLVDMEETIEVTGLGDRTPRTLKKHLLAQVIEPRVEELFKIAKEALRKSGYDELLSSGIVITGGSSLLPGLTDLAEEIFLKPARIGMPNYDGRLSDIVNTPRYATAHGLLREASKQAERGTRVINQKGQTKALIQWMKDWFVMNF